jgi:hypothetical protein
MNNPDFFLSARGESKELANPRACWIRGRVSNCVSDDHMLIEISPPLIGQKYGIGEADIVNLILSPKWAGRTLHPIREWPCHVYVSRILDQTVLDTLTMTRSQVEMITWGSIFRTFEEAS